MNRKVSELPEAQQIRDNDVLMILQSNENKQVTIDKLLPLKQASVTLESTVNANINYTVPFYYKVGNNSLEVIYCSTKLQKRTRLQRDRQCRGRIKYNTIHRLCRRLRHEFCRRLRRLRRNSRIYSKGGI